MIKPSTGLLAYVLKTGSLSAALNGGFIKVYAGIEPTSADDAVSGTLLFTVSLNNTGTGISFDTFINAANQIYKPATAVWAGTSVAIGDMSYYRHVAATDTGAASLTEPRLQGTVGPGQDMQFASYNIPSIGVAKAIDGYTVGFGYSGLGY